MRRSGHSLQVFACFVDPLVGKERFVSRTLQMIDLLKTETARHSREIALCTRTAEIRRAQRSGKKIALLGIEGGHTIANDLGVLRCYRRLGVVLMTLTWAFNNDWADSSGEEERWGGLTAFGQEVVREMNRIHMIVDVSHVSDKTFWQTLRVSSDPVIASHSSIRKLCNNPRNMSDPMIKAMADKGGAVFINFFPAFIDQKYCDLFMRLNSRVQPKVKKIAETRWQHRPEMATYEEERLFLEKRKVLPKVGLERVVAHIEHAARIAGVEAVGFGSDYDGTPFMPEGMEDCTVFPVLCEVLRKRGFKSSEVEKIAGGNFLRIFRDVVG
jgi:membrane dipeptidase